MGGTDSHFDGRNHQALDHEITMQHNDRMNASPNRSLRDRRSSFGGISALLTGEMDIELKFDDDEDDEDDNLDERAAQREHTNADDFANLTDTESVERGRGALSAIGHNSTMLMQHEMGSVDGHSLALPADDTMLNDTASHISFAKEKEYRLAVDALSAH